MSYRVLDKKTERIQLPSGVTMDVTYIVEVDEAAVTALVRKAADSRNGMVVSGPLRVRVLKRAKV